MNVTIKYGKKKHKGIAISSDSFEDLQGVIMSLTQVAPGRQKIIIKGKMISCDADMKRLKNKCMLVVMGSADTSLSKASIDSNVKFVEDMSVAEQQKALATLPPGLQNLGNTCYLNSCLQCLKGVVSLKTALINQVLSSRQQYQNQSTAQTQSVAHQLGQLFIDMDNESSEFVPTKFVTFFRSRFPRFASRGEHGWEQQDADEAYTELISSIRIDFNKAIQAAAVNDNHNQNQNQNQNQISLSSNPTNVKSNIIDDLFGGECVCELKCNECEAEQVKKSTETFLKLRCFIDSNTRHLNDGIAKGLSEDLEKNSSILARNAVWSKKKLISKLPPIVCVQLVRFFWKAKSQKNTKVLRRVVFPEKLDLAQFCEPSLKKNIEDNRREKVAKEDKERELREQKEKEMQVEIEKEKEKESTNSNSNASAVSKSNNNTTTASESASASAIDTTTETVATTATTTMNVDVDDNESKTENSNPNPNQTNANGNSNTISDSDSDSDIYGYDNETTETTKTSDTGFYELIGVVTHQGRSANSGHYIGYVKDTTRQKWLQFDDENVKIVKDEDIKNLYGGGDWQMGFLCFYKKIE